ncbi:MAG TPA: TetR/AcrR family transcriptional regulator [Acidimicrobiales bacterium]|nr:TetR/AcrR family transcriptional regulator [Acidimicrobiales bacterium]
MGHSGRRTQAERSAATRAALLRAARRLFTEKGFFATGREEIAQAAGVTRGALYHHFAGKEELFRAVLEELEQEVLARVAEQAVKAADPLDQLAIGSAAYLDAAMDPAVQRICLLDGPSVLGWDTRQELAETYGMGLIRQVLLEAMEAGHIERRPVEPLAHVLMAGLHEAAMYVARSPNPRKARNEVGAVVERIVGGL